MCDVLLKKIDGKIEAARSEVAETTIKLINIRSVEEAPLPGAPFGPGPRKVLDEALEMGREAGFFTADYNVGVVSMALKDGEPDLGIWLHGDVVPEGTGWNFEPYNAVEYKGCIVGRGATDNKGQLAAAYHLLRIFKELNVELNYNPAIYVGSNEETGMKDLIGMPGNDDARGFVNVCKAPALSLVPDGGFSVGYGGKGKVELLLRSKNALENFTFTAGRKETPGKAAAIFGPQQDFPESLPECVITKQDDGTITVTSDSPPRHGASPDPAGNMITKLAKALADNCPVNETEKGILRFLEETSRDIHGGNLGISMPAESMGPLTVAVPSAECIGGHLTLLLQIRYPIETAYGQVAEKVSAAAESYGFEVIEVRPGVRAYMADSQSEVCRMLHRISEEYIGEELKPYTLSGATYANYLPDAYVFGMSGFMPPDDFPKGRGGAHGLDEAVSLDRLERAMKIYARALLALNDMKW